MCSVVVLLCTREWIAEHPAILFPPLFILFVTPVGQSLFQKAISPEPPLDSDTESARYPPQPPPPPPWQPRRPSQPPAPSASWPRPPGGLATTSTRAAWDAFDAGQASDGQKVTSASSLGSAVPGNSESGVAQFWAGARGRMQASGTATATVNRNASASQQVHNRESKQRSADSEGVVQSTTTVPELKHRERQQGSTGAEQGSTGWEEVGTRAGRDDAGVVVGRSRSAAQGMRGGERVRSSTISSSDTAVARSQELAVQNVAAENTTENIRAVQDARRTESAAVQHQESASESKVLRQGAAATDERRRGVSSSPTMLSGGREARQAEAGGMSSGTADQEGVDLAGAQATVAVAETEVLTPEQYEQLIRRRRFAQGQTQLQEQRETRRWAGRSVSASVLGRPQPSRTAASAAPRRRVTVADVARGVPRPQAPTNTPGGALGEWLVRWRARQRVRDTVRASRKPLLGTLFTVFPFLRSWGGFL
jgi:hypothetical protein